MKNEIIYLNDCLNGRCKNIIDSRKSKKCINDWYICDECGCCCSHAAFERRLKFWNKYNGTQPGYLMHAVNSKIGHLEKAEYYCYHCGQIMEIDPENKNKFKCKDCNIEYNTEKYKLEKYRINCN